MEYDKFLVKYNKIGLIENCTIDIDLLKNIHKYLFEDSPSEQSIAGIFRYKKGPSGYDRIRKILEKVSILITRDLSIDEYIALVCKSVAVIWMYQPFNDGNTRCCLLLQRLLLKQRKLDIHLDRNTSFIDFIGIVYSENDAIPLTIDKVKKHILNINNR